MTPKEKAIELVEKYHKEYDLLFWDLTWIQAKLCASIAVNEILSLNVFEYYSDWTNTIEYWEEVKQEIEKL
jgi:hypothetical protein